MGPLQSTLLDYLSQVPDFRCARGQRFAWSYLLALIAVAVAAGKRHVVAMVDWAQAHGHCHPSPRGPCATLSSPPCASSAGAISPPPSAAKQPIRNVRCNSWGLLHYEITLGSSAPTTCSTSMPGREVCTLPGAFVVGWAHQPSSSRTQGSLAATAWQSLRSAVQNSAPSRSASAR